MADSKISSGEYIFNKLKDKIRSGQYPVSYTHLDVYKRQHTEFGKIARELASADSGSTPLQEKMAALGKRITILGSAAAAVVFLIQLILFLSNGTASLDLSLIHIYAG